MSKYGLKFISDEDLLKHVGNTIKAYRSAIDLKKFNKNIIDPIKLTFDSKVYKRSVDELIQSEVIRQVNKSNSNRIGYFNQNIFTYIGGNKWKVPKTGFDVVNEEEHIFVEMKNKHNTMNSSSSQKTYMKMQNKILRDSNATCMLVEVISKKSQNKPWQVSLDGERIVNDNIRIVSVDKFYEIVTGDKYAFLNLVKVLPLVIEDAVDLYLESDSIENTVLKELREISPDVLKSLYILGFEKYEGFEDFEFANV